MYSVSSTYLQKIKQPSRDIDFKVVIGDATITTNEIIDCSVETAMGNNGMPGIGGVIASKISLKLIRHGNAPSYYTTQTIKPSVAIKDDAGNWMWVPLGVFYPDPDSVKRTDQTVEVECFDRFTYYDNIEYKSTIAYPATLQAIANEMKSKYQVNFATNSALAGIRIKTKPVGQSVRSVIAEMAELMTANAIYNREGLVEFRNLKKVDFSLGIDNYFDFSLESDNNVKITKLICEKEGQDGNGNEIADLECGDTTGATLRFTNDSITTQAELQTVFGRMFPLTYTAYSLKLQGMPHLDAGDIITLTDRNNITYNLPIVNNKLSFTGGLISEFSAKAPSTNQSTGSNGTNSITQTVQQVIAGQITVENLLAGNLTADNIKANSITADRIDTKTITAESGFFDNLTVDNAMIANGTIDFAKINQATVGNLEVGDASIGTAKIKDLAVTNAKIGNLAVDTAKIKDASITNAKIGNLAVDSAKIKDAAIETAKIKDAAITSAKIGDAQITNAKIDSLDAGKITTGTLSADRISAGSITADKLTVGGRENVVLNPNFEGGTLNQTAVGWSGNATQQTLVSVSGAPRATRAIKLIGHATNYVDITQTINKVPCKNGEQLTLRWSSTSSVVGVYQFGIVVYNKSGTVIQYIADESNRLPANVWRDREASITITHADAAYFCPWVSVRKTTGEYWFTSLEILRKTKSVEIENGAITADKISANAITAGKIDAGAITTDKLAAGSVTAGKIDATDLKIDGTANINAATINTASIKDGAITNAKIGNATIESAKIKDAAITTAKIGDAQITSAKIQNGAIGSAQITDGAIINAKIGNAAITNAKIADATIEAAKIKSINAGTINTGTLDASKITVTNLKADSITTGSITVEGNNLLHDTNWANGLGKWKVSSNWSIDTTVKYEGCNTIKSIVSGLTTDAWGAIFSERVACAKGQTFVFSCWVYTDNKDAIDRGTTMEVEYYQTLTGGRVSPQTGISLNPTTNGVWQKKVYSFKMDREGINYIAIRFHHNRNGRIWIAQPMLSKGTIASVWKLHNDELISDGAIDNDKLGNESITTNKLNLQELFVSDNAFVGKLTTVDLDAGQIKTGKITSEFLDIEGLVKFSALDPDLAKNFIFDTTQNHTYINGGMIATNTIKAQSVDTRGLTVQRTDGTNTFTVSQTGEIEIDGLLHSSNFSDDKNTGYRISTDGKAIFNEVVVKGDVRLPNAGMTDFGAPKGNENLLRGSGYKFSRTTPGYYTGYSWRTNIKDYFKPTQTLILSAYFDLENLTSVSGQSNRAGIEFNISFTDGTTNWVGLWCSVSGGTTTYKGYRELKYTVPSGKTIATINGMGAYLQGNATRFEVNEIKLELGDKRTPWCLSTDDITTNLTRIWAGAAYENRDSAPFRVNQAGELFATKGTFQGKVATDQVDIGLIHLHNNEIVLDSRQVYVDEETGVVSYIEPLHDSGSPYMKLNSQKALFNTDFSLHDKFTFTNSLNHMKGSNLTFDLVSSGGLTDIKYDPSRGAYSGLNLVANPTVSQGHHVLRHSAEADKNGTLVFDSEGTKGQKGDFAFTRKNFGESAKVYIHGELTVSDNIQSDKHKVEMRNNSKGFAFYSI